MADGAVKERTLLGHPIGLSYLFCTEAAERFSYYGMRAILIYTLVYYLLLNPTAESVAGYHGLKHFFELVYNGGAPLDPQPLSSIIYGNYTSFVYLTPVLGGIIADRWLGQRNSVVVGALIMAIGEFTLMAPQLFFVGLLLLIIGNGFFKPNISTQVGNLYKPGDSRIDRAFSIFYVGINLGAFFSPLICGSLGESYGYHWGYFAAGAGMLLGLLVYLFALRTLPQDRAARIKSHKEEKKPLTGEDWRATIALLLLAVPGSLFWAAYEQQGNTIAIFASDLTDRRLIPGLIDWQIPYTWFQAFNPGFIMLFTPLVIGIWAWQAKRKKEPSVLTKMALGNFMMGGVLSRLDRGNIFHTCPRSGELAVASRIFRGDYDGRALFLADRAGVDGARSAAADRLHDDGRLVDDEFRGQPAAGFHRQLFQPNAEG